METWRNKLLSSINVENAWIAERRDALQRDIKNLAHQMECSSCQLRCYEADMVMPACKHPHCFDCVSDRMERQCGYFERKHPELYDRYPILKNLMVCCQCHTPALVRAKSHGYRIAQQDRGNREEFQVDLRANLHTNVRSYYQNQRRSLFGKFSFKGLYFFERARFTAAGDGQDGLKAVNLRRMERLDGSRSGHHVEIFLEDWSYDRQTGDPLGWQYAVNWPKNEHEWANVASALTFVRRRKMFRASIRISMDADEVQAIESISKRQWGKGITLRDIPAPPIGGPSNFPAVGGMLGGYSAM